MFKKFLIANATISLLAVSTSGVITPHVAFTPTNGVKKEYSHPNLTENAYFGNEIQKALADYRGENEPLVAHTHAVEIANVDDGFLFPVADGVTQENQIVQREFILKNDSNFTQRIKIPFQNLSYQILKKETHFSNEKQIKFTLKEQNYQFQLNERNEVQKMIQQSPNNLFKTVAAHTSIKVRYTLKQKIRSQKYNYLLPIENDKWCKKNTGVSGKVYQISPQELFDEIKNNSELLEYYFGLNEFYQYRGFIGKDESPYLVWAATRIVGIQVEQSWTEESTVVLNF